ncbi:MAG: hypothetical protein IBJ15_01065 [Alphaproteobacteria bacterium]|nr:hypothetical protein [Alphaproteobacteria bacterium]
MSVAPHPAVADARADLDRVHDGIESLRARLGAVENTLAGAQIGTEGMGRIVRAQAAMTALALAFGVAEQEILFCEELAECFNAGDSKRRRSAV